MTEDKSRKVAKIIAPTTVNPFRLITGSEPERTSNGWSVYCEEDTCLCYHCIDTECNAKDCLEYVCLPKIRCKYYQGPRCERG